MATPCIVLVAKCPMPGQCKTRLIPMLGPEGSAMLARAMLSDVLLTLTTEFSDLPKYLLYAPPTDQGRNMMLNILHTVGIQTETCLWTLIPVEPGSINVTEDPQLDQIRSTSPSAERTSASSQLTPILTNALSRVRQDMTKQRDLECGPVVFLGMDSPQLPLDELDVALMLSRRPEGARDRHRKSGSRADSLGPPLTRSSALPPGRTRTESSPPRTSHLCPCPDGGYGLISIPPCVLPEQAFSDVVWSQSSTALSQLKALTDAGVHVRLGRFMYDIDEPDDVEQLCRRLQRKHEHNDKDSRAEPNSLLKSSSLNQEAITSECPHTRQALIELGFLELA